MSLNVGDIVRVNNNDAGMTMIYKAEVIHTPRGEGDLWGFKDCTCGNEIYTSERITVYVLERTP